MDRIALDIHGGRKEGYRAWTHKQNFPQDVIGRWQVRVLTEDGQMIGVLRFIVTDTNEPAVSRQSGRIIRLKPGGDSQEPAEESPASRTPASPANP